MTRTLKLVFPISKVMDKESVGNDLIAKSDNGKLPLSFLIAKTVGGERETYWEKGFLHPEFWPFKIGGETVGINLIVANGLAGPLYPATAQLLVDQILEVWTINDQGTNARPIFRRV